MIEDNAAAKPEDGDGAQPFLEYMLRRQWKGTADTTKEKNLLQKYLARVKVVRPQEDGRFIVTQGDEKIRTFDSERKCLAEFPVHDYGALRCRKAKVIPEAVELEVLFHLQDRHALEVQGPLEQLKKDYVDRLVSLFETEALLRHIPKDPSAYAETRLANLSKTARAKKVAAWVGERKKIQENVDEALADIAEKRRRLWVFARQPLDYPRPLMSWKYPKSEAEHKRLDIQRFFFHASKWLPGKARVAMTAVRFGVSLDEVLAIVGRNGAK